MTTCVCMLMYLGIKSHDLRREEDFNTQNRSHSHFKTDEKNFWNSSYWSSLSASMTKALSLLLRDEREFPFGHNMRSPPFTQQKFALGLCLKGLHSLCSPGCHCYLPAGMGALKGHQILLLTMGGPVYIYSLLNVFLRVYLWMDGCVCVCVYIYIYIYIYILCVCKCVCCLSIVGIPTKKKY